MRAAREARDGGRMTDALEHVDAALALDPDFLAAHALRGTLSSSDAAGSHVKTPASDAPPAAAAAPARPPKPAAPSASGENESLEERVRRRRIDRCIAAADAAMAGGRLQDAAAALEEIRELDPDSPLAALIAQEMPAGAMPRDAFDESVGGALHEDVRSEAPIAGPPLADLPLRPADAAPALPPRPVRVAPRGSRVWAALAASFAMMTAFLAVLLVIVWPRPEAERAVDAIEPLASREIAGTAAVPDVAASSPTPEAPAVAPADDPSRRALIDALEAPPVETPSSAGTPPRAEPPPRNEPHPSAGTPASVVPDTRPAPSSAIAEAPRTASLPPPPERQPEPPPVAAPPASTTAATVPTPTPVPPPFDDTALIRDTLQRYRRAYNGLDARLAHAVYPAVDEAALARAFDSLRSQSLDFDACTLETRTATARAICKGSARYVPKIGSREPRAEPRVWTFTLAKVENDWMITSARVDR